MDFPKNRRKCSLIFGEFNDFLGFLRKILILHFLNFSDFCSAFSAFSGFWPVLRQNPPYQRIANLNVADVYPAKWNAHSSSSIGDFSNFWSSLYFSLVKELLLKVDGPWAIKTIGAQWANYYIHHLHNPPYWKARIYNPHLHLVNRTPE